MYERNPDINECLSLRGWAHSGIIRWLGVLSSLPALRRRSYDWILCSATDTAFSFGVVAWLTGIPIRLGFEHSHRGFLFTHSLPFPAPNALESLAKINLRYCHALGIPEADPAPVFPVFPEDRHRVKERLLRKAGTSHRPLVAIHPGSKFPANHWMPERFISIARWLIEVHHSTVVFVGAQEELSPYQGLFGEYPSALDWGGRTSLGQLAALLEMADVALLLDSGPAHLAAAVKSNAVILRSARASRVLWGHDRPNCIDLWRPVPCTLCDSVRCPNKSHPRWCMDLITIEDVKQAVRQFLPASTPNALQDEAYNHGGAISSVG